jgi:hypothetical protein
MFPSPFPSVPQYRGEADPVHAVQRVVCLEKLDGMNTRIGIPMGATTPADLRIGGRSVMEDDRSFRQDILLTLIRGDAALCQRLLDLSAELGEPVVLYGETCGAKIQKMGFIYGRPHFVLFGATVHGGWVGYSRVLTAGSAERPALPTLRQLGERLQLPVAPCLFDGPPDSAIFAGLVKRTSQHSVAQGFARSDIDNTQEGIVIWSDPVLLDPFGEPVMAKLKPSHRREYTQPADERTGPDDFARRAVPPERIRHAREHLLEHGQWLGILSEDMPALVQRVTRDVSREVPEYQSMLREHGRKTIRRAISQHVQRTAAAALDE